MGRNTTFCCECAGCEVSVKHPHGERNQAVEKLGLEVGVWKSLDCYLIIAPSSVQVSPVAP